MQVTKEVEFDYGHRVPSHKSKCKNLHGHRGKLQVTLQGDIKAIRGESDDGMVIDFSDIKILMNKVVGDFLDHAFIVYSRDHAIVDFLSTIPDHKTVLVNFIPTAENLAQWAFNALHFEFSVVYGDLLILKQVRFFETPTSIADATELSPPSEISNFMAWTR